MSEITAQLMGCESRQQATEILENLKLSKKGCDQLAKSLDVWTKRTDTKERIVERIVEATVGVKLRNIAIQSIKLTNTRRQ